MLAEHSFVVAFAGATTKDDVLLFGAALAEARAAIFPVVTRAILR